MKNIIFKVKNLVKNFKVGDETVKVLRDISFNVNKGDFLVVFGPSGSGKSTLLHTLLGLEPPSSGQVFLNSKDFYAKTDEDQRSVLRKETIGTIFQRPSWIQSLTVLENIAFPLTLRGIERQKAIQTAKLTSESVGLTHKNQYYISQLSSGQQEMVALARALVNNPDILIADEPTGNLDVKSGKEFVKLLSKLNKQTGKTILMVTHDLKYLNYTKSAIRLVDGQIQDSFKISNKQKLKRYRSLDL